MNKSSTDCALDRSSPSEPGLKVVTETPGRMPTESFIQYWKRIDKERKKYTFVLCVDDCFQWLGFANGTNAKRRIAETCKENVDYICVPPDKEDRRSKSYMFITFELYEALLLKCNSKTKRSTYLDYARKQYIEYRKEYPNGYQD